MNTKLLLIALVLITTSVNAVQIAKQGEVTRITIGVYLTNGNFDPSANCTGNITQTNNVSFFHGVNFTYERGATYYFNTSADWTTGAYLVDTMCDLSDGYTSGSIFQFDISKNWLEGWLDVWDDIRTLLSSYFPSFDSYLNQILQVQEDTLDYQMRNDYRYHILIDNDTNFKSPAINKHVWYSEYELPEERLEGNSTGILYYWKVRIAEPNEGYGNWSEVWTINRVDI